MLVGLELNLAFAFTYGHRHNLLLEVARANGGDGPLLAGKGKAVLILARDVVAASHPFSGFTHWVATKGIGHQCERAIQDGAIT